MSRKITWLLTISMLITLSIFMLFCEIGYQKSKINSYERIADEFVRSALTDEIGYNLLAELAAIGPRLAGSENAEKALLWAEARMEEMGFEAITLRSVPVPRWKRGDVELARIVSSKLYDRKQLHVASLGGSVSTPKGGITAELIEVLNFEELRNLQEKVKGKIIFFNRPMEAGTTDTFSAYVEAVTQRVDGPAEAAEFRRHVRQ